MKFSLLIRDRKSLIIFIVIGFFMFFSPLNVFASSETDITTKKIYVSNPWSYDKNGEFGIYVNIPVMGENYPSTSDLQAFVNGKENFCVGYIDDGTKIFNTVFRTFSYDKLNPVDCESLKIVNGVLTGNVLPGLTDNIIQFTGLNYIAHWFPYNSSGTINYHLDWYPTANSIGNFKLVKYQSELLPAYTYNKVVNDKEYTFNFSGDFVSRPSELGITNMIQSMDRMNYKIDSYVQMNLTSKTSDPFYPKAEIWALVNIDKSTLSYSSGVVKGKAIDSSLPVRIYVAGTDSLQSIAVNVTSTGEINGSYLNTNISSSVVDEPLVIPNKDYLQFKKLEIESCDFLDVSCNVRNTYKYIINAIYEVFNKVFNVFSFLFIPKDKFFQDFMQSVHDKAYAVFKGPLEIITGLRSIFSEGKEIGTTNPEMKLSFLGQNVDIFDNVFVQEYGSKIRMWLAGLAYFGFAMWLIAKLARIFSS